MSASLIGRLRSSTFRLSTTAVLMSLTGSRFSSESAPGPEWVDGLLAAGHNADLLIAEAYCFERMVRFHLDYVTLREKLSMIGAKRLVLTHMSPEMLGRVSELQDCEAANDGLEVEIV
jgi:hypothetical protein